MKIEITLEEAILLAGMKQMRQIVKSDAPDEKKQEAVSVVFAEVMRIMDSKGIDE